MEKKGFEDFPTVVMTLLGSFMYMSNVYILAVTGAGYSREVGLPESFTGILSGIGWIFVVGSCFIYSFWTNSTYKIPILCSALMVLAGNFLYFIAYDFNSGLLLVVSKLIMGLGAPRIVHRRYLSVYVSAQARTK